MIKVNDRVKIISGPQKGNTGRVVSVEAGGYKVRITDEVLNVLDIFFTKDKLEKLNS